MYGILDELPIHKAAHGFMRKRSAVTHASNHIGCSTLITADVKNFFDSLHFQLFKAVCKKHRWDREIVRMLRALCFYRDLERDNIFLPQGTPTSPILSNVIMEPIDNLISTLAKKTDFVYSRFADDIALSSKSIVDPYELEAFVQQIHEVFSKYNLTLHKVYSGDPRKDIKITGIHVTRDGLEVPRKFKDQLEYRQLVLHEKDDNPNVTSRRAYIEYVEGPADE